MANDLLPDASEHQHQVALFQWAATLTHVHPELALMYAIPNAAKRSRRTGRHMKLEGLKPGIPDVCLPVPRGPWHALYIELKALRGRLRDNQRRRLAELHAVGNACFVCKGWEEAAQILLRYLRRDLASGAGGW